MAEPRRLLTEEERAMIAAYKDDPVLAAESLFKIGGKPLRLDPYQRVVLRSLWEGKANNLLLMGRGMAKTFILGIFAVLKLLFYPAQKIIIISSSYRQAKNVFAVVDELYENSPYIQQAVTRPPTMGTTECVMECRTEYGLGYIKALPIGDGTKIRGTRASVLLLDEYAFIPEIIIQLVIKPMSIVVPDFGKNQIVMASTAYYQFNHLYKEYLIFKDEIANGNPEYNLQEFTYKDTPNHIDMNMLEEYKKKMPRSLFLMEYENVFLADGDGYFPPSLLASAQTFSCPLEDTGVGGAEYVLGIDPATEADNFALAVVKVSGDANKLVKIKTIHRGSIQKLVDEIRWHCDNFNVVRICMDEGGGGYAIRDLLAEDYYIINKDGSRVDKEPILMRDISKPKSYPSRRGRRILDMVYFSSKEVHNMNVSLLADLENGGLVIPNPPLSGNFKEEKMYDEIDKFISEITKVTIKPNSTSYLSFDVPQGEKKDRYSATLLAAKAAREVRYGELNEAEEEELPMGFWAPSVLW